MRLLFSLPILATIFSTTFIQAEEIPIIEMGSRGVSNFIAKMEKERTAHVAFLGGSITQKATGHSGKVADWLKENWSDVDFTFTNAGLSSTCSVSGAFRFERDILSKGTVDLLIVEFAVNDDQDAGHDARTATRGLEGILQQYFRANPKGDVISVQFVNPEILKKKENGEEAISVAAHKKVARHYDVPIVDVGEALAKEIAEGTMTWDKDYGGTHPNDKGYEFATQWITQVIEDTISGETPQMVPVPDLLDSGSFARVEWIDPQEVNWLGGWKWGPVSDTLLPKGQIREDYLKYEALRSDEAGNYLYYTFSGNSLGAFVLAGPDAGRFEVSINGEEWRSVELYHRYSKNLNYPRSVLLAEDLGNRFHTAAIRVAPSGNPESEGTTATILGFAVGR